MLSNGWMRHYHRALSSHPLSWHWSSLFEYREYSEVMSVASSQCHAKTSFLNLEWQSDYTHTLPQLPGREPVESQLRRYDKEQDYTIHSLSTRRAARFGSPGPHHGHTRTGSFVMNILSFRGSKMTCPIASTRKSDANPSLWSSVEAFGGG